MFCTFLDADCPVNMACSSAEEYPKRGLYSSLAWQYPKRDNFFPKNTLIIIFFIIFFPTWIKWLGFVLFNETTQELIYYIDGKTFVWIYIFLNICLSTKYLKWKKYLWMIYVFLAYFIDGKTFVWIYIFLNICLSTKYLKWKIYLWMIYIFLTYFIDGKTVVWISLILDDIFFF